jgi:hypothetical protein
MLLHSGNKYPLAPEPTSRIGETKIKEGAFMGPQLREIARDSAFGETGNEDKGAT